ncbi:hypothetical protein [Rhodopirellula bahusiensis]|uniref:hypothetical protein n=1 Tax=Rhodopirellula bahusiensis TaxID=2014065 RepID=UPI0013043921|nr:hypothetical protein [Rhodopirellula bahusiensis]
MQVRPRFYLIALFPVEHPGDFVAGDPLFGRMSGSTRPTKSVGDAVWRALRQLFSG